MKKITTLCTALCIFMTTANANDTNKSIQIDGPQQKIVKEASLNKNIQKYDFAKKRAKRDSVFEEKLGLTEVQKLKARELRKEGFEKLHPIMEQIRDKKQEAEMIRRSRMAVQMQEEKLAIIDKELKVLEKQANEIRKKNMKDFESILTKEQRKTLKEMKKEGRKRFEAKRKPYKHSYFPQNK